jgi:cytochrome b subunit of formate dehydrogenase
MRNMDNRKLIKKIIRWLLAVVVVLYLITGLGITEFRTIETLTFGLLTKNLSFKMHDNLLVPFLILLVLHICLSYIPRKKPANRD